MKKLVLFVLSFIQIVGCSSTPVHQTPENTPDAVLSRIDDLKERPEWLRESTPFEIKDGIVVSLGQTTLPASNSRVEAGYRIAQNNAKAAIANVIESRLNFIFQNAEEGVSLDSTQARSIGAEASDLISNSLRPGKNYWEKIATTNDNGSRLTQFKVFSTVTMPEIDFKKAIQAAIEKRSGKGGLSKDFAEKVNKHWDQFTSGDTKSTPAQ